MVYSKTYGRCNYSNQTDYSAHITKHVKVSIYFDRPNFSYLLNNFGVFDKTGDVI